MHDESGGADRGGISGGGTDPKALPQVERPVTVPLSEIHRAADFRCARSARINGFFGKECSELLAHRYCRVFILPNPSDTSEIWGFYTLSASLFPRERTTGSEQKRIPGGIPVPMALIGYMGRNDCAPKGLGKSLIVDAARRVHRNEDFAAWGLTLDAEGGPANPKLWEWYKLQGFTPAKADPDPKKTDPNAGVMYAALKKLIPELNPPK
ncbi:MAG: hypothetical protein ACREQI_04460 [Candidatus Binataceae bacterium]